MVSYQEYFLPTLLVGLAIVLDLVVNRQFNKKDIIHCIMEVPREIQLLSMGFVITYTATSTDDNHATVGVIMVVISFFLSLVVYAMCRYSLNLYSDLANMPERKTLKKYIPMLNSIVISWVLSVLFYYYSVTICLGGKIL